ncbi:ATP-binding protein [Luteimonas sp. MJ174]|uniref:ATP-binding protein n=1 Tax=Luteimonas sp. MJ174 TaxID=3129237 RepID=UPI0031BB9C00
MSPDVTPATTSRSGWTLLREFARLLLLAVVLPVLALAGVLLWQTSMSVRAQAESRLTAAATSTADDLDAFLKVNLAVMRVLADRRNSERTVPDLAQWRADLARIHLHYPAFRTLLVTDADGVVVASEPSLPARNGPAVVADREYFLEPRRTGAAHVSGVFQGRGLGDDILVAASVPLLVDGAFAGVLEGSIPIGSLELRAADLEEQGFELLVLDRAHSVVQASAGMPQRPMDALASPGDTHGLAGLARDGDGVHLLRGVLRDGSDAFARPVVLGNGWQLVLLQPSANVEAEVRRTALAMLGLLALVLAGVIVVVLFKMRRLGGSVQRLLGRMQTFALGSGSARIAPADVPRELLPLAEAMNALAARARASYEEVNQSLQEQRRLREELQAVAQRLLTVQEDERRTLSRELHDDIGQSITAISLAAGSLGEESVGGDPAARREILDEITAIADQTVLKLRNLSLLMRPPQLDSLGLEAALRGQVALMSRNSGLDIRLELAPMERRLPDAVELACFRIAQEALTNVARHANATRIAIEVEIDDDADGDVLVLRVSDDGDGIDPDRPGGLGLLTMRERATQLGGRLAVLPRPGGGTIVQAVLPLPRDD